MQLRTHIQPGGEEVYSIATFHHITILRIEALHTLRDANLIVAFWDTVRAHVGVGTAPRIATKQVWFVGKSL